jgi:serine/threonine-protein kinase
MIAGRRPFPGDTTVAQLARLIEREPELAALPAETPEQVRDLIRRCLIKDPTRRLQAIGDARVLLDELLIARSGEPAAVRVRRAILPWALAGALGLALLALLLFQPRRASGPGLPVRLSSDLGVEGTELIELGPAATLSPDGTTVAFSARAGESEEASLYVRRLDELRATALPGTAGAFGPFFSPDGREIGFFASGRLKRVSVEGGIVSTVCPAPNGRGGSWAPDGTIVFSRNTQGGLVRVKSAGGDPAAATALDQNAGEATHRWPQVLPGGNAVLFTASNSTGSFDDANAVVQSLTGSSRTVVIRGGFHARYLTSGHLVYMREGSLFAVPFDLGRLETTGPPRPLVDRPAATENNGGAHFAFS